MDILIGVLVGFVAVITAYKMGIKDGMGISKGEPPKVVPVPVVKGKKTATAIEQGIQNILSYTGDADGK